MSLISDMDALVNGVVLAVNMVVSFNTENVLSISVDAELGDLVVSRSDALSIIEQNGIRVSVGGAHVFLDDIEAQRSGSNIGSEPVKMSSNTSVESVELGSVGSNQFESVASLAAAVNSSALVGTEAQIVNDVSSLAEDLGDPFILAELKDDFLDLALVLLAKMVSSVNGTADASSRGVEESNTEAVGTVSEEANLVDLVVSSSEANDV